MQVLIFHRLLLYGYGVYAAVTLAGTLSILMYAPHIGASWLIRWNDLCVQVLGDWQYLSLIFDRLLLYVYTAVTLAGTLSILMYAPHIFTDFDQHAFKRETQVERCCKSLYTDQTQIQQCFANPRQHKC